MNAPYIAIQLRRKLLELIPTYCVVCKQKVSFLETDDKGTFTQKCNCGCHVYKQHEPDEFNSSYFYTRNFISKTKFRKDFKDKDELEKMGFKKTAGGKYVK